MVSSTPRPHFTPGKDPAPILQEAGWALGPVWTGGKSRPHRDSIPDHPARSQSLYRLSYPAHIYIYIYIYIYTHAHTHTHTHKFQQSALGVSVVEFYNSILFSATCFDSLTHHKGEPGKRENMDENYGVLYVYKTWCCALHVLVRLCCGVCMRFLLFSPASLDDGDTF